MNLVRDNQGRAKTAIIFIYIVLGLEVASIISTALQLELIQRITTTGNYDLNEVQMNDLREAIINISVFLVFIASAIFFIMWFRRAYYNLKQRTKLTSYSDGWAAGSWFVPILSLFRPYQIMNELYTITPKVYKKHGITPENELNKGMISLWWTLWIIASVFSNISARMTVFSTVPSSFKIASYFEIISAAIFVVLSFVIIKIIKDYTKYALDLNKIGDDRHFEAFADEKTFSF